MYPRSDHARIRRLRSKGWTVYAIASLLRLSSARVSQILRSKAPVLRSLPCYSCQRMVTLCHYCHITLDVVATKIRTKTGNVKKYDPKSYATMRLWQKRRRG